MILPGRVHVGHILQYVGMPLAFLFAWDVAVTITWYFTHSHWVHFPSLPITLLGSADALFLSLRNSAAYARWWEARILWGSMVNASRTLAREAMTLLPDADIAATIARRQVAYVHALRLHLRRQSPWDDLVSLLPANEIAQLRNVSNVPNAIHCATARLIADALPDPILLATIIRTLSLISDAQGGMERIKNTPLPRQYATYPVIFTHVFCILLPLGLVETLGLFTALGSTMAGFLFLALLQIGNDMQNPFENLEDDIPMTALTRAIEIDLRDGLGETHSLKPVHPQDGILW
jgi:ion channel-forming bestrophin family protein